MARTPLKGIPNREAQRQVMLALEAKLLAMDPDQLAAARALGEDAPSLPAGSGRDPEIAAITALLHQHLLTQRALPKARGRPFDATTLLHAGEVIDKAGVPLRSGSKARATKVVAEKLHKSLDGAQRITDRLVEYAIRLGLRPRKPVRQKPLQSCRFEASLTD
jgi:hypothetical protein